jgi:hypothetical protein
MELLIGLVPNFFKGPFFDLNDTNSHILFNLDLIIKAGIELNRSAKDVLLLTI